MAIEIHIRVRDTDWDAEYELAERLADTIENVIPSGTNIPVLVFPVEDPEREMEPL